VQGEEPLVAPQHAAVRPQVEQHLEGEGAEADPHRREGPWVLGPEQPATDQLSAAPREEPEREDDAGEEPRLQRELGVCGLRIRGREEELDAHATSGIDEVGIGRRRSSV
jgi:hypothetical protein